MELDEAKAGHVEKGQVLDAGEGRVSKGEDREAREVREKEGLEEKGKLLGLLRFMQD